MTKAEARAKQAAWTKARNEHRVVRYEHGDGRVSMQEFLSTAEASFEVVKYSKLKVTIKASLALTDSELERLEQQ